MVKDVNHALKEDLVAEGIRLSKEDLVAEERTFLEKTQFSSGKPVKVPCVDRSFKEDLGAENRRSLKTWPQKKERFL